jgi:hypothetical protein
LAVVIRRARFGTALVAICLASGATACGSSSEPESRGQDGPGLELVGFAGERRDVMEAIRAKLDEGSALTRAELTSAVTAPENEDGSPGAPRPDDVWLSLFAETPEDDVSRTRAVWEASLVLAALWRRLEAQGDHGLRGGSLRFAGAASEGDAVGLEYWFASDAGEYLFTDAAGRPSPLVGEASGSLEEAIRAEAEAMGLTVDEIDLSGIEGTTVSVEATANDPLEFVQTFGDTYGNLFGDPGLLEGIFLVVREPGGDLIKTASWSTGLQGGEGGLSDEYAKYGGHLED